MLRPPPPTPPSASRPHSHTHCCAALPTQTPSNPKRIHTKKPKRWNRLTAPPPPPLSCAGDATPCQELCLLDQRCVAWMWQQNPDLQCGPGAPPYDPVDEYGCKDKVGGAVLALALPFFPCSFPAASSLMHVSFRDPAWLPCPTSSPPPLLGQLGGWTPAPTAALTLGCTLHLSRTALTTCAMLPPAPPPA
jgi:hypothetical protein